MYCYGCLRYAPGVLCLLLDRVAKIQTKQRDDIGLSRDMQNALFFNNKD
ncbi:hypothetical protein ASZ90_014279 [hydrocarbon metagenome]|uniref:Uncharacterized protein n=1 Tax=hydrocarbon metagenome TaxID=938273 RepID=A0A0W8F6M2_9ZZZZ